MDYFFLPPVTSLITLPVSWSFGGRSGGGLLSLSFATLPSGFPRPAALEGFALGGNLPEVFRAALGRLFTTKPASFGGNNTITDFLSAMGAFHAAMLQHLLLFIKREKMYKVLESLPRWTRPPGFPRHPALADRMATNSGRVFP